MDERSGPDLSAHPRQVLDVYREGTTPNVATQAALWARIDAGAAVATAAVTTWLVRLAIVGAVVGGGVTLATRVGTPEPSRALTTPSAHDEKVEPEVQTVAPAELPAVTAKSTTRAPEPAGAARPTKARVIGRAVTSSCSVALADELAVLEAGRIALGQGRAAETLRLLDAHEQICAEGPMLVERTSLRLLAQCERGDGVLAAQRFLVENPNATAAARIRRVCGIE